VVKGHLIKEENISGKPRPFRAGSFTFGRRSWMKSLEGYCKKALEMGFDGAKVIKPRSIITAEW
jgi:hypothetical protein